VLDQIEASVRAEVEAGVQFAMNAPFPASSEVVEDVFA
jgi:TPP-dependent pyruvate/acetoin dehydrogenase alpha subunit